MRKLILQVLVLSVLAACDSANPLPTPTLLPPTHPPFTSTPPSISTPELPPIFEITFGEGGCMSIAPAVLPPERYSFAYIMTDETIDDLNITLLTEGYTIDENMALQSEPGDYFRKPDWAKDAPLVGKKWSDSYGAEVLTFALKLEGTYAVTIGGYNPNSAWFCPPIEISEDLSD